MSAQDDVSEKSQKSATVAEPEEVSLYNYLKQKTSIIIFFIFQT